MTRADLRLVAEPDPERSLGDAIAYAFSSADATQREVERGDDHMTLHEGDDYGDTDRGDYDRTVGDLRDVLRGHQW